jgi:hypothetical protein
MAARIAQLEEMVERLSGGAVADTSKDKFPNKAPEACSDQQRTANNKRAETRRVKTKSAIRA